MSSLHSVLIQKDLLLWLEIHYILSALFTLSLSALCSEAGVIVEYAGGDAGVMSMFRDHDVLRKEKKRKKKTKAISF